VNFLPWQVVDNTSWDTGTGFTDAFRSSPSSLRPDIALDYLYFLPEPVVDDVYGEGILGAGWVGVGLGLISDSVFGLSSGNAYPDVISHELGHTLGLEHIDGSQFLMNPFNSNANESLSDIYPSGNNDQITSDEVSKARQSLLLTDSPFPGTPEPGTLGLFAIAVVGTIVSVAASNSRELAGAAPLAAAYPLLVLPSCISATLCRGGITRCTFRWFRCG
jgi:hypothetical protein